MAIKQSVRTRKRKSATRTAAHNGVAIPTVTPAVSTNEIDYVVPIVETLLRDLPDQTEPSTALLLYALLQTPSTRAHGLLGTLPVDLRAQLTHEAWQGARLRNGISVGHVRAAAQRIAEELCDERTADSRHLLMACLIGAPFVSRPREWLPGSTATEDILGRSNSAVRAMVFAGVDPVRFLDRVRASKTAPDASGITFPSFFVFSPQRDRVKVFRIEEIGEFNLDNSAQRYPATLGLLDHTLAKRLEPLLELESLVNSQNAPELAFQRFFETHPEFLMMDDYVAARPGLLLTAATDFGLKPDFFLARRDSPLWDIAELKLPNEALVRGRIARRGLAAAVHWGVDQLRRYREYFLDTNAADIFRRTHGMEVYHPRLTLIIGRDESFGDYHERQRLAPPEARILTYDDILRMARHRSLILPFRR